MAENTVEERETSMASTNWCSAESKMGTDEKYAEEIYKNNNY